MESLVQTIFTDGKSPVEAFAESRVGGRKENQDSYGWCDTKIGYLVTVCDGMGGGPGGKTASSIAVREIVETIKDSNDEDTVTNIIIKAVRKANMAIYETSNENTSLRGMGSTATVLLINAECAYVAHVGDSRVYQLRGSHKVFRTFDHSLVFEMVSQGVITEEQARLSAQSNVVTRALGIKPDIEVEIHELPYQKGDRFVLCSDGIHGTMPESELIKLLSSTKYRLGVLTDDIVTYVDNLGRTSGGGHDNLTLAIVKTKNNSKLQPKMSRTTRYILYALSAVLAISLILNIVQCARSGGNDTQTEIKLLTDSVTHKNDTIQALQKKISAIDIEVGKLNAKGTTPLSKEQQQAVESITNILKTNSK